MTTEIQPERAGLSQAQAGRVLGVAAQSVIAGAENAWDEAEEALGERQAAAEMEVWHCSPGLYS